MLVHRFWSADVKAHPVDIFPFRDVLSVKLPNGLNWFVGVMLFGLLAGLQHLVMSEATLAQDVAAAGGWAQHQR
jgi:hypothetical protein